MSAKERDTAQRIAHLKSTLARLGVPSEGKGEGKEGEEEEMEVEMSPEMAALPLDVRQRCVFCLCSLSTVC